MNRCPSTISRELHRNRDQRGYRPKQAHEVSQARMWACENGSRIADETCAFVDERLGELWSPEQICGRLMERGLLSPSYEAIYRRIYADKRNGGALHRALPCQKVRRKRYGGRERRGTHPQAVSIEQRPAIVNARKRFGDWEGDLVNGVAQQQALVRSTNANPNGLIRQFFPKKMCFESITRNDIEFAMHRLNHRPRKCLGFKTPHEVFAKRLHSGHNAVALQT